MVLHRTESEENAHSAVPDYYSSCLGWRERAEAVSRYYNALPAEERQKTAIFANFYGQAGAIDHFGAPHWDCPRRSALTTLTGIGEAEATPAKASSPSTLTSRTCSVTAPQSRLPPIPRASGRVPTGNGPFQLRHAFSNHLERRRTQVPSELM